MPHSHRRCCSMGRDDPESFALIAGSEHAISVFEGPGKGVSAGCLQEVSELIETLVQETKHVENISLKLSSDNWWD